MNLRSRFCWLVLGIMGMMGVVSESLQAGEPVLRWYRSSEKTGTSMAVSVGNVPLLHTAQVFPWNAAGEVAAPSVSGQFDQLTAHLKTIVTAAGGSWQHLLKLNVYLSDETAAAQLRGYLPQVFSEGHYPVVTWVSGLPPQTPAGILVSADAVVALSGTDSGNNKENNSENNEKSPAVRQLVLSDVGVPAGFAAGSILPPGDVVYVAGQLEARETLAASTAATLESLIATLRFLELAPQDVVELKAFVSPMTDLAAVEAEFRRAFAPNPVPATTFVEWISQAPSIEIELVAWAGKRPLAGADPVAYLTPPGMKASPVYSRLAQARRDRLIYIGSLYGENTDTANEEVLGVLDLLKAVSAETGSDLRHLLKATYYVSRNEPSSKLNELRPRYYDPQRPPAASKAVVRGVGLPGKGITIDMIAVPTGK